MLAVVTVTISSFASREMELKKADERSNAAKKRRGTGNKLNENLSAFVVKRGVRTPETAVLCGHQVYEEMAVKRKYLLIFAF